MQRTSARRLAAIAAATTLPAALLGVGIGTGAGVANAAGTCNQSSHTTKNDASTVWVTHTYDKSVTVTEAAAGTNVTYKIEVGTTGIGNPYVNTIRDYAPADFGKPVSAKVTSYHFIQGQVTEDVSPVPTDDGGWRVSSTGWFVNSGNSVTAEFTYKIPNGAATGAQITSGGIDVSGTVGVGIRRENLNACFTVREKNAGEGVTGSMDGAGLGSNEGQLSSTGSVSDILGDTITRVIQNGS
jgi:beta-lactamase class A